MHYFFNGGGAPPPPPSGSTVYTMCTNIQYSACDLYWPFRITLLELFICTIDKDCIVANILVCVVALDNKCNIYKPATS